MAAISTAELNQKCAKLERKLKVLQDRFDKLAENFCLYHVDDRQSPAFGIILPESKGVANSGVNKGRLVADVVVFHKGRGAIEIAFDKPMIDDSEELRGRKWEPLVLPAEFHGTQMDLLAEVDDDPNGFMAG